MRHENGEERLLRQERIQQGRENRVVVVFKNRAKATAAVRTLSISGFRGDEIALHESSNGNFLEDKKVTRIREGIIVGAISGILYGLFLSSVLGINLFLSMDTGIKYISSILACGAIGGMAGALVGGFMGEMFVVSKVEKYRTSAKDGSVLVDIFAKNKHRASLASYSLALLGGKRIAFSEIKDIS